MNVPMGYLRSFITMLVVVHHAALAYVPLGPQPPVTLAELPRVWQAFPIVDKLRDPLLGVFVAFNDISMMALMFFLSGLFVLGSLERKGTVAYLSSRVLRLGLPFVVTAGLIAPMAYYATYLGTLRAAGPWGFLTTWLALGSWPAGPAWFLWVLLVFDVFVVAATVTLPGLLARLRRAWLAGVDHPGRIFVTILVLSIIPYAALRFTVGPFRWFSFGPFYGQSSRIPIYFLYFALGVVAGPKNDEGSLLSIQGGLARCHLRWMVGAALVFGAAIAAFLASYRSTAWLPAAVSSVMYPLCCLTNNIALVALFLARVTARRPIIDDFSRCAFGIFLVHYPFVTFLQRAALDVSAHPILKTALVSLVALMASWATVKILRWLPGVSRVI